MNKYLIPICDIDNSRVWIKTIMAKSNLDCQEKIMEYLIDLYDLEDAASTYREFVDIADTNYNIIIGEIKDIEEI